ncbi:MAG: hypothetical protein RLO51_15465 [Thalassobaculum sp.]|uniref:hypothetical protein n=1 Tax=Thalassobaculum sp. TaxID=2022740 RepID=UPI0032ED8E4C
MALPSVVVLRQLLRARLRQAAWSVAGAVVLLFAGTLAVGLAVAAGVIATADRIGLVEALLAWSGGLALVTLSALHVQMAGRRRRRLREIERAGAAPVPDPGAALMSDIGFRAGMSASNALPPLGLVAAAFIVGTLVARSGGRR